MNSKDSETTYKNSVGVMSESLKHILEQFKNIYIKKKTGEKKTKIKELYTMKTPEINKIDKVYGSDLGFNNLNLNDNLIKLLRNEDSDLF